MAHHTQTARLERIIQIAQWLGQAKAQHPQKTITKSIQIDAINKAMITFGCSQKTAKEYVRIAQLTIQ
mgnify:CR=1 FL=1